jgi:predicted transcriptional regulator
MKLLEGIARGEKAIEEGRTVTHAQAKQRLSRWLK